MDASNPLIADDVTSEEERLEKERLLHRSAISGELSDEDIDDLSDDLRGDSNHLVNVEDDLTDIPPI